MALCKTVVTPLLMHSATANLCCYCQLVLSQQYKMKRIFAGTCITSNLVELDICKVDIKRVRIEDTLGSVEVLPDLVVPVVHPGLLTALHYLRDTHHHHYHHE